MSARQLTGLFIGLLVLFLAYDSVYTVDARQRAVLFQLQKVEDADLSPGLHFKLPVVETVMTFDDRVQLLDGQTENFPTADQQVLEADYYVRWRIADPVAFYRATGGQKLIATDHLSSIVERGVRDAFAAHSVAQIVGDDHDQIIGALLDSTRDQASQLGLTVTDVRFEHIDLPADFADAVYQRMRAELGRVAADLRARAAEAADKIRADADSQAQVILADAYRDAQKARGEGDARAAEIYAKAYGQDPEFFRFYRSINAYREAFHGGQDVLVLQPNGEFFRYFGDASGGAKKR